MSKRTYTEILNSVHRATSPEPEKIPPTREQVLMKANVKLRNEVEKLKLEVEYYRRMIYGFEIE